MVRLIVGLVAVLTVLGLSAAPAQAFGPMMLLIMPTMMGGHQHSGDAGHKDLPVEHADKPQAPSDSKHDHPASNQGASSNPPTTLQHVDSRDAHPIDTEHGR